MEITQENVNKLVEEAKMNINTLDEYMKVSQEQIEGLAYKFMQEHPEINDMSEMKREFEQYLMENNLVKDSTEARDSENEEKEIEDDDIEK